MKKLLLAFVLSIRSITLLPNVGDKVISVYIKVWGFLKYYHPTVAKGKLDWDKEFMSNLPILANLKSDQDISRFYRVWIDQLGVVQTCDKCNRADTVKDKVLHSLDWLNSSSGLDTATIRKLIFIRDNRSQGKNYYLTNKKTAIFFANSNPKFESEAKYPDSTFPCIPMRMLTLARYWNMVNYFFPYKYAIDQPWSDVLAEMIPKFRNADDTISYHKALQEMVSKIDDSHSRVVTPRMSDIMGNKWPPFGCTIIGDTAVVSAIYNDSLCTLADIRFGDIIISVNGVSIPTIIQQKGIYIPGSNSGSKMRDLQGWLLNDSVEKAEIRYSRLGINGQKFIYRYDFKHIAKGFITVNTKYRATGRADSIINNEIGYINLGILQPSQVGATLRRVAYTKGLILDIRNYPASVYGAICNYIGTEKRHFANLYGPDQSYPGVFTIKKKMFCGRKNLQPYKGKIIVLTNQFTQSMAEFAVMAFQATAPVTVIGSRTAGADGDMVMLPLPGGYMASMSALGIYYPDGRETQRVGISPNIYIAPTTAGIREKQDEVLKKAIAVLEN